MKNQSLTINGLNETIAVCEALGLSKCFAAYADNCAGEYIMEVGFNPNSGYTYIALENGLSICSMLGRDVEYIVTDFDNGNEMLFDNYDEALSSQELLNNQ
jgi:hypothetical protein